MDDDGKANEEVGRGDVDVGEELQLDNIYPTTPSLPLCVLYNNDNVLATTNLIESGVRPTVQRRKHHKNN
jgi:hypothetical protein